MLPAVSGCLSACLAIAAAAVGCVCAAVQCVCVCPDAAVCIVSVLPPDSTSEIESLHSERSADPSATHRHLRLFLEDHTHFPIHINQHAVI